MSKPKLGRPRHTGRAGKAATVRKTIRFTIGEYRELIAVIERGEKIDVSAWLRDVALAKARAL